MAASGLKISYSLLVLSEGLVLCPWVLVYLGLALEPTSVNAVTDTSAPYSVVFVYR
jgi:hypothetical protein